MHKHGRTLQRHLISHAGVWRRAAVMSVLGPLVWLCQAALLADVISGLLVGSSVLGAGAAAAFIVLAALRAYWDARALALAQRLSAQVRQGLRADLARHVLRLSPQAQHEDPGAIASLMGEGIGQIGPWVERYRPAQLRTRIVPFVVLALVAWQSWAAAIVLVMTGPLIPVFMALVGWAAEAASRAHLVEQGALNRILIDRSAALVDLRLLGAGTRAADDLYLRSDDLRRRTMAVLRLAFLSSAVLEFFAALGVAMAALYVGLSLLGLIDWGATWGSLSPFGGIFILLIVPDFYQPLRDLASSWHDRAAAEAAGQAIDKALSEPDMILGSGGTAAAAQGNMWWDALQIARGPKTIYLPPDVLHQGEAVALVGLSGSGKSSALAAVAGLIGATGRRGVGVVAMDDSAADRIRAAISLIPQTLRFPEQTVREFLSAGGIAQPEPALWAALARVNLDHVVRHLSKGLDSVLGETGGGISGGEARRLMIARALTQGRAYILADEPTADLDVVTGRDVIAALMAAKDGGVGLLIATHDPALVAQCDRVISLGGDT